MIGAGKIDDNTNDLERLKELFKMGLNNSEIGRIYRTNAGLSISRTHISQIRRGGRWNPNKRSFVMKNELDVMGTIQTEIGGMVFKTVIAQVIANTELYHIYLCYVNSKPVFGNCGSLLEQKPTRTDLIGFHTSNLNKYLEKNTTHTKY